MKKQLIFKEVLAMLNSGAEYKAITLAEVAKRCKMGKSTIYEYFSSKDEMIYNAIIFYINKMLKFFSTSFKISTFEPSLKIWIKAMMVCMKSNKWMLLPWTFKTYASYLNSNDAARAEDLLGKSQTIIIKLLTAICKKGVNEGYLTDVSDEAVEFAYYGAIGLLAKNVGDDFDYTSKEGIAVGENVMAQIIKHLSNGEAEIHAATTNEEYESSEQEEYVEDTETYEDEYAEDSQYEDGEQYDGEYESEEQTYEDEEQPQEYEEEYNENAEYDDNAEYDENAEYSDGEYDDNADYENGEYTEDGYAEDEYAEDGQYEDGEHEDIGYDEDEAYSQDSEEEYYDDEDGDVATGYASVDTTGFEDGPEDIDY